MQVGSSVGWHVAGVARLDCTKRIRQQKMEAELCHMSSRIVHFIMKNLWRGRRSSGADAVPGRWRRVLADWVAGEGTGMGRASRVRKNGSGK